MIGFPDRPDRMRNRYALRVGALSGCEEIPDAATEIRATQQRINDQRRQHDDRDDCAERHARTFRADGVLCATCRFSRYTTTTDSSTYRSVNIVNGMTRPGMLVTASSVRMIPYIIHG